MIMETKSQDIFKIFKMCNRFFNNAMEFDMGLKGHESLEKIKNYSVQECRSENISKFIFTV